MIQGHTESHIISTAVTKTEFSKVCEFFVFVLFCLFVFTNRFHSLVQAPSLNHFFLSGNINIEQYYLCNTFTL